MRKKVSKVGMFSLAIGIPGAILYGVYAIIGAMAGYLFFALACGGLASVCLLAAFVALRLIRLQRNEATPQ